MRLFIYDKRTRKLKSCLLSGNTLYTIKGPPQHFRYCLILWSIAVLISLLTYLELLPLWALIGAGLLGVIGVVVLLSYLLAFYWYDVEYGVSLNKPMPSECVELSDTTYVAFDDNKLVVVYSTRPIVAPLSNNNRFTTLFDCRSFVEEFEPVARLSISPAFVKTSNEVNANRETEKIRNIIERYFGAK